MSQEEITGYDSLSPYKPRQPRINFLAQEQYLNADIQIKQPYTRIPSELGEKELTPQMPSERITDAS